jgi:hypothetical protein
MNKELKLKIKLLLLIVVFLSTVAMQIDLPDAPGEAFRTLAAWLLDLLMGVLAVYFAISAFKTGRKTQQDVTKDHEGDQPVGTTLKKWAHFALALVFLLSTFLLPTLIFGQQGPIGSILSFLIDWILGAVGIGGGGEIATIILLFI